jgi:hypothetical protein
MATWELYESGYHYDTIEADSAEEALETAKSNVDRANYADEAGTLCIDVEVRRIDCKDESLSATVEIEPEFECSDVQLDPPEPECKGPRHHWAHATVGGLKESPAVWANGGVVMHEVCTRCGCGRKTDIWAKNATTGERLTAVTYEPGTRGEE